MAVLESDKKQVVVMSSAICTLLVSTLLMSLCAAPSTGAPVSSGNSSNGQDLDNIDWWKKTNYYHIYIRSFKDTNGDGSGDLRGVIESLDYLKSVGVETLLMSPFYSSPMVDCGYDIDDYLAINPLYGTMEDFETLVAELKARSMRMVVDFVPNHSSNKHKWFECSERAYLEPERCGKYKDYYVWSNSTRYKGKPNNWASVFGGVPAWTWSPLRKEYYLHQFLREQPDLNFRNPAVREEFKEIARFWLRKGADGLRLDAVLHLLEDEQMRDNPVNEQYREFEDDPYDWQHHTYTRGMSECALLTKEWREVCREPEFAGQNKVAISEAYEDIYKLIEYYGHSPSNRFVDLPFNTELFGLAKDNMSDSEFVQQVVGRWVEPTRALNWPDEQGAMSPWIIWVTGNHDNKRPVNRVGRHNSVLFKWLAYLLPGVPVNYYGDELPLHDANFNAIPQRTISEGEPTRLPFRAPMAWDASEPAAGFSSSADIWMPLNANWRENNVEALLAPAASEHNDLKLFRALNELRREHMDIFVFADAVFFKNSPTGVKKVLALARPHPTFGNLMLLANLDADNEMIVRLRPNESIIRKFIIHEPPAGNVTILMTNYEDYEKAPQVRRHATLEQLEGLVLARSQAIIVKY